MNIKFLMVIVFLLLSFQVITGQVISATVNHHAYPNNHILQVQSKDTVLLKSESKFIDDSTKLFYWVRLVASKKSYDNTLLKDRYKNYSIEYNINVIKAVEPDMPLTIIFDSIGPGTTYWGIMPFKLLQNITWHSIAPLYADSTNSFIQIVSRKDDSYIGYLTELFNTPFILAPKFIPSFGHQTDLRIGSDCAEFLIYGKRRQGFNIPYCGPKLLKNYLEQISPDSIFNGCIIHFGEQTALLYEDKGIIGKLDDEDLLLQCYYRGPEIIKLKDSEFRLHTYKPYKWKKEFEISGM